MLRIGPAGNSVGFYESGGKHTYQAAEWLKNMGLNAFEYSFGRGISMSAPTAEKIKDEFAKHDIKLSVHAPYYINFASENEENIQKSFGYILSSIRAAQAMGGRRVIFHPGAQQKAQRGDAFKRTLDNIRRLTEFLENEGLCGVGQIGQGGSGQEQIWQSENIASGEKCGLGSNEQGSSGQNQAGQNHGEHGQKSFILCAETMGKHGQIGTLEEIAEICKLADYIYPCVDFGHVNSYTLGGIKTEDDYRRILDFLRAELGDEKTDNMHIHFSKIMFGKSGEIKHLTLADTVFGPEYPPLAHLIDEYKMTPTIICESDGVMAEDALIMKNCHNR